jgi:hypothetical protein
MPPRRANKPEQTVAAAVERDLVEIAKRDAGLAESSVAMSALRLAWEMDTSGNSATSKSMCAKALQEAMRELRDLAPAERKKDGIDRLAQQRAARRTRVSKTAGKQSS